MTDSISQIVVSILSHELFKKHIIYNVVCSISVCKSISRIFYCGFFWINKYHLSLSCD